MNVPILMNHDGAQPIGRTFERDGHLVIELQEQHAVTLGQLWQLVGNAGVRVTRQTADERVIEFEILCWSVAL